MDIRKLKREEHILSRTNCQTVFLDMPRDDARTKMKNPLAHAAKDDIERWGAFDGNGRLLSSMEIVPYTMQMNGQDVKLGGIAGVATLPEARSGGLVRKIFEKAFADMIENGQTFSYLFPFSYDYYRNFGYEICMTNDTAAILVSEMAKYPYPKNIRPYEPGDDIEPFAKIYNQFIQNRNLAIVRNKPAWKKILGRDPYKRYEYTYLNRDSDGNADAYILYNAVNHKDTSKNRIDIKELCWSTVDGLHNIFGFLGKLSAEFGFVDWKVPGNVDVFSLFSDCYSIAWTKQSAGMNRILDVTAGLLTLRSPMGNGKITFDIIDTFWKGNTGVYTVQWEDGNLTVHKSLDTTADVSTNVETLTQLVTGYLTPEEAMYKKGTSIFSGHTQLDQLFPKQKLYMMETF